MNDPLKVIKTDWLLVFLLWFAGFGAAMQFAKFSVSFSLLKSYYSASDAEMSWVMSVVGLSGVLLTGLAGVLAGLWGYRRVLLCSLTLGAVLSLAQAFLPLISMMFFLRVLEGFSHLTIIVTAPILMARTATLEQRSLVLGLWGTFFGVTFVLAHALSPWWLSQFGVSGLFLVHAGWMFVIAVLLYFRLNASLIKASDTVFSWKKLARLHMSIYGSFRIVLLGLLFMCYTLLFIALLTFLPRVGVTPDWVKLSMPLLTLLGAFLTMLLIYCGVSPLKMLAYSLVFLLLALCVLFFVRTQDTSLNVAQLAVFLTLGLQQGSVYAAVPYLNKEPNDQALSITAIAQLGSLGSFIGSPLFAFAWLHGNAYGLIGLALLIVLLGLSLTTFYVMKNKFNVELHA